MILCLFSHLGTHHPSPCAPRPPPPPPPSPPARLHARPPSLARPSPSCFSSPHRQVLDAVAVPPAANTVEPSPSVACLQPSGRTGAPAGPFRALREPSPVSAIAAM